MDGKRDGLRGNIPFYQEVPAAMKRGARRPTLAVGL